MAKSDDGKSEREKIEAHYKKKYKKSQLSTYERIDYLKMARMDLWPLKGFFQSIERLLFGRRHDWILKVRGREPQILHLGPSASVAGSEDVENERKLPQETITKIEDFQELVTAALKSCDLKKYGKDGDVELKPAEFLPWYQRKGFLVPDGLIDAMEAGHIKESAVLLEDMREAFLWDKPPPVRKKTGQPAPTTGRAKTVALKREARKIYDKLVKKDKPFTYKDILNHRDWPDALEDSWYNRDELIPKKRVQNWLGEFRNPR